MSKFAGTAKETVPKLSLKVVVANHKFSGKVFIVSFCGLSKQEVKKIMAISLVRCRMQWIITVRVLPKVPA